VTNYNEKDNVQEQPKPISQHVKEGENHEEFKKDRITSTTKLVRHQVRHLKIFYILTSDICILKDITHDTIQIDNRSDLRVSCFIYFLLTSCHLNTTDDR
jgi:hypothetical protein